MKKHILHSLIAAVGVLAVSQAIAQTVVRSATPDSTWNETVIAPQCSLSAVPATILAGQTSNISVTGCGTPTNPAAQYRWTSSNPTGPALAGAGGVRTFATAGTYCYTVRGASIDGWGKPSAQACVAVGAASTPLVCTSLILSPASVTEGDTRQISLSAVCSGSPTQFSWGGFGIGVYASNEITSSGANITGLITPDSSINGSSILYTVRASNSNGVSNLLTAYLGINSGGGFCPNGATNPPACDNVCFNGFTNYPTCGATSGPPLCVSPQVLNAARDACICANGSTNAACTLSTPPTLVCTAPLAPNLAGTACTCPIGSTYNDVFDRCDITSPPPPPPPPAGLVCVLPQVPNNAGNACVCANGATDSSCTATILCPGNPPPPTNTPTTCPAGFSGMFTTTTSYAFSPPPACTAVPTVSNNQTSACTSLTCNPGSPPPDMPACQSCYTSYSLGFPRQVCTPQPSGPGNGFQYLLSSDGCRWQRFTVYIPDCANP